MAGGGWTVLDTVTAAALVLALGRGLWRIGGIGNRMSSFDPASIPVGWMPDTFSYICTEAE